MVQYRLLEIKDKLFEKPYWKIQKKIFGLWWSEYFQEQSELGGIYYDKEEAVKWFEYYTDKNSRFDIKIIAQNQ